MRLVSPMHMVDYHGVPIWKPVHHPYVGMDRDGKVYSHSTEPTTSDGWAWTTPARDYFFVAMFHSEGMDFEKSLVKYDVDGNIVKPKRKFLYRGVVVTQPNPECEFVHATASGAIYWSNHLLWAASSVTRQEIQDKTMDIADVRHWQTSQRHIDELQEVFAETKWEFEDHSDD